MESRAELEALDRDTLIARAEAAGVTRARILTRPELVDELLLRHARAGDTRAARSRGFFGVARDLLARVIERGLNLPDAADRLRNIELAQPAREPSAQPLPTVTLAEIYAAQGHRGRAIETLRGVLSREPEHSAARSLLAQLEDDAFEIVPPKMEPEPEEEPTLAAEEEDAQEELPPAGDNDECVAIPVRAGSIFVCWSVRRATAQRARAESPDGALALRLVMITPTWEGPRTSVRDCELDAMVGEMVLGDMPPRALARAAVGWRSGERFVPIAHSPSLEARVHSDTALPGPDSLLRWTPRGVSPLREDDPDAFAIARALGRARGEARTE